MTRRTKVWIAAILAFVAYLIAGWFVGRLFTTPRDVLSIRIGFAVLGLATAGVILWFAGGFRSSAPAAGDSELAGVLRAAETALAKVVGPDKKRRRMGAMPAVLVLGPAGSAKTTAIVRSDIAAELIAGEAQQGDNVMPTRTANVWLGQDALFVEAAESVVADAAGWKQFLRAVRPRSFVAALTGRPQAPRFAVVCLSCEELRAGDAVERIPELAKWLNARLSDVAQAFGITLPTYVLFTKFDTLPHFEAYVRNLSADEAQEPLGASLSPAATAGGAGAYTDRITSTLDRAFAGIYGSLAERRLSLLQREHDDSTKLKSYEFPREFRKIMPLAVDFLRELARPSALRGGPALRGFYFAGVQPVFVTAGGESAPAPSIARQSPGAASATVVFAQPVAAAAARPAMEFSAPRMRKIPRWDFLPPLLREVVLGDIEAARATQRGARVGGARHAMLGVGIAAAVVLIIGFTTSFIGNRRLANSARARAESIRTLPPSGVDLPALATLQRLDSLRSTVATLSDYVHNGTPIRLRWGLSSADALYREVRPLYFAAFQRVMFGATRSALVSSLRRLPDAPSPSDDYGAAYNPLKAYVIVTSEPRQSTRDFLSPVLQQQWLGGRQLDADRTQLSSQQFDLYATELAHENVFAESADAEALVRARTYLKQFSGNGPIYQHLLAEAGKTNQPIQFNRLRPGSAQFLNVPYEVPGAFTKNGWTFMQDALAHVGKYFSGEKWVLGTQDSAPIDTATVVKELRGQYTADYVRNWRSFLQSASVARYGDLRDAARKLQVLSGNQSPLLSLLSIVSQNTHVAPAIDTIFQPAQSLTPPTVTDKLVGPTNESYMKALIALQAAIEQTANAKGPAADQAAQQAAGSAAAAKTTAAQLANAFTVDQQGQVHTTVQQLIEAPINYAASMVAHFGADQINGSGQSFCGKARPLLRSLFFSADGSSQFTVADLTTVLKPGTGALAMFTTDAQQALQKQGKEYVPTGTVKLSPGFMAFVNRASALSDALFAEDQGKPQVTFSVEPQLPEGGTMATIVLDGVPVRSAANLASRRVTWPAAGGDSRVSAVVRGTEISGPSFVGPWSVLQLFQTAEWRPEGDGYRVEWRTGGHNADGTPLRIAVRVYGVNAAGSANVSTVLHRPPATGASCGGDIAQ